MGNYCYVIVSFDYRNNRYSVTTQLRSSQSGGRGVLVQHRPHPGPPGIRISRLELLFASNDAGCFLTTGERQAEELQIVLAGQKMFGCALQHTLQGHSVFLYPIRKRGMCGFSGYQTQCSRQKTDGKVYGNADIL
jgi:hypothetical protein